MAVLLMLRPWRHPTTSVFHFRARVPSRLVVAAGGRKEAKWSLGTKDEKTARTLWPRALQTWAEMQADWERQANAVAVTPSLADEIAAKWAAWIAAGAALETGSENSDIFDAICLPEHRTPAELTRMWDRVEAHGTEALRLAECAVTPDTLPVLLKAMLPVVAAAYLQADLRGLGVSGSAPSVAPLDLARAELPPVPLPNLPRAVVLSFDSLVDAWQLVAAVKPRTKEDTAGMVRALARFLGHEDAGRVTAEDMIRWRTALKREGLSNNTWNNRVSLIGRVFEQAKKDQRIAMNPTVGLRLEKDRTKDRFPYDDDDARRIFQAARKETKASLRWSHWVMAFTGMRISEVLQLTADDVKRDPASGIWHIAVKVERRKGKGVKNEVPRNVPIHPALEAEGFILHAQEIGERDGAGAPLFPDKGLDKFGNRGGRGWNVVGTWVRKTVGLNDPDKAPNHSWRHRLEDELRSAEVAESDRDAIVGHARATTGRHYGVRGEALARLARELGRVKSPL